MTTTIDMSTLGALPRHEVHGNTMVVLYMRGARPVVARFDNLGRFTNRTISINSAEIRHALETTGEFKGVPGLRIVVTPC